MPWYRLPDLTYDYGALEPATGGQIMELHHAAYVKGFQRLWSLVDWADVGTRFNAARSGQYAGCASSDDLDGPR